MTTVGRNDPCPCGSGLKHKRCCLLKNEPTGRAAFTRDDRESALRKLMRFSDRPEFGDMQEVAEGLFWGGRLDNLSGEQVERALALEQNRVAYLSWFAFDLPFDGQRTIVEHFLDRERVELGPGERTYLEKMRDSCLALYEVEAVNPDEGLALIDLWTSDRVWVRERAGTEQVVRWDIVAARLFEETPGEHVLEGGAFLFPPSAKGTILREVRQAHRAFTRRFPGDGLVSFFKWNALLIHHLWLDEVLLRPLPTMVTAEGDVMEFAKAVFAVRDRTALVEALANHPDFDLQDDDTYVWTEGDGSFCRSLGTFVLEGDRLVLETTSRKRVARGRRLLERLAGSAVKYRTTRYESVDEALAKARKAPQPESREIPPEVEAHVVGEFYEKHYRDWLDQPIPALGHRTPRHAARLKTVRPELVALLKQMENQSERARRAGRPAYDFGWMWVELGLERP